jgi:L-threonylcarbamoyladenylate synthase
MCESWHIREAVRRVANGGIIAYPTETLYGLGCDPFNGPTVLRLLTLKQRSIEQGLILVASHFGQVESLLADMPPATRKRVMYAGRQPVTWVLPCLPDVPYWMRGRHDTLAIRITTHPVAAGLCDRWAGPLVSTSANIHGRRPATGPLSVHKAFHDQLDYVLHDLAVAANRPSEIRDGITGAILRPG